MIRELTKKETEQIYREQMLYDFPKEELKPLGLLYRLMEEGHCRAFGSYEEDRLEAYALLIHGTGSSIYLLDYFAVCRGGRGKGVGSRFLKGLYELLEAELLILEVEDVDKAADEEERLIRSRRMDFYHRNGVRDTRLATMQFGVDLVILYLSDNPSEPETDRRIYESLDHIYRFVFGDRYGDGTVRWTRTADLPDLDLKR